MTISYGADVSKEAIYEMHSAEHWTKLQSNGDGKMKKINYTNLLANKKLNELE
jgi:hypothetical protein